MTTSTAQRAPVVPPSPPSDPRVRLVSSRAGRAILDGGWWPRSNDPVAELPGLILALGERYGTIRRVLLNSTVWSDRFGRLAVGPGTVRLGWFTSLDPGLAIATTDGGDQLDLLVVPPNTAEAAAYAAMARAADPANRSRAPEILAAMSTASAEAPAGPAQGDGDSRSTWDNEGGRGSGGRPHRAAVRRPDVSAR